MLCATLYSVCCMYEGTHLCGVHIPSTLTYHTTTFLEGSSYQGSMLYMYVCHVVSTAVVCTVVYHRYPGTSTSEAIY